MSSPGCSRAASPQTPRCTPRRPRVCNSAELLQQVEFTQKQIDMTKEALAAQDERTKKEIKATEAETVAKNKEMEGLLADVGKMNSELEKVTAEVHSKEAKLVTLHTANQILAQHMRQEIEDLREAAERERIAKEQLAPQINEVNAALCSMPNRSAELERQQQDLQAQLDSYRNDDGQCNLSENFMTFDNVPPDFLNFSPRSPVQPRDLAFVSPSIPARDTPSPLRNDVGGQGPSQRSPNYYTNLLLNPRPPTPPQLPNYNTQQWLEPNMAGFPRRPRSAGPPVRDFAAEIRKHEYRARTPPPASPPLPTFGGAKAAGNQWFDEGNACQLPPPPPTYQAVGQPASQCCSAASPPGQQGQVPYSSPAYNAVSPIRNEFDVQGACERPSSPPIQTAYTTNQFNSPPIQVRNVPQVYVPTPPPLPNYDVGQYYKSPLQEPVRRPLRPIPRPENTPMQNIARSPSPVRPMTPPMQYPNYDVTLSPGNQCQLPQYRPPTPPPLPDYDTQRYVVDNPQVRLRRNLRRLPQQAPAVSPVRSPVSPANNSIGIGGGGIGAGGIGDMSLGGFSFQELEGYGSPALMGMSTPPPRLPTPVRPVSPVAPPNSCGSRGGSPPPNGRQEYNQAQLNACPVGPNVDGFCPCTQMAMDQQRREAEAGIRQIEITPPPFNDMSFEASIPNVSLPAPNQNQQNNQSFPAFFTPPGVGLRNVTGNSIEFRDMSFSPQPTPPRSADSYVYNRHRGINEESFNFDQGNLSFSPIQQRQVVIPPGIGDMSPLSFQELSLGGTPEANDCRAPSPNAGAWALDGIQDQSMNFHGAANLSFSPIQMNRQGPARRIDDVSALSFRDMSFGSPPPAANQNLGGPLAASSPIDLWGMDGILGQSFDFNEGNQNMSFSPIRVNGHGVGQHLDDVSPPPFQDMSFQSGLGMTPPRANPALNISRNWGLDGIQDQSFNFDAGANLSFSPIRNNPQGPARRLADETPPTFLDMSLPSGISSASPPQRIQYGGAMTLADRRGDFGIEDVSFELPESELSFGTPPPQNRRPGTPVSPFAQVRTPPGGSPDLFQFSPSFQMTPPSPGSCARPPPRPTPQAIDLRRQLPPNFNPTNVNMIHFSPVLSPDRQGARSASPPPMRPRPVAGPRDLRYELAAQPEAIYGFQQGVSPGADLNQTPFVTPPQNRGVRQSPNMMAFSPEQADLLQLSPVSDMIQFSPNRDSPNSCARTR